MKDRILRRLRLYAKRAGLRGETQNFAVLCHQRSGSNMLTSIINQHPDIRLYGQLFKDDPDFRRRTDKMVGTAFTGQLFDDKLTTRDRFDLLEGNPGEREDRNTEAYLHRFFRSLDRFYPAVRLGFKFHGGTLYRDEIKKLVLDKGYRTIILHREDLFAAAVSWYQAREFDRWVRVAERPAPKKTVELDVKKIKWFAEKTKKDVELWQELAAEYPQNTLELTYEQITDPDFDFNKIWQFLEVKPLPNLKPRTKKLIKDYSHITNLAEARRAVIV